MKLKFKLNYRMESHIIIHTKRTYVTAKTSLSDLEGVLLTHSVWGEHEAQGTPQIGE